jgi:hypothetical protein
MGKDYKKRREIVLTRTHLVIFQITETFNQPFQINGCYYEKENALVPGFIGSFLRIER